jgi:hypothetical protein
MMTAAIAITLILMLTESPGQSAGAASTKLSETVLPPLPRPPPRSTFCETYPRCCDAGTILYMPHTRENPSNVVIEVPAPRPASLPPLTSQCKEQGER